MSKLNSFKRLVLTAVAVTGTAFIAIQFIPVHGRTNPPASPEKSLFARVSVTPEVQGIMRKACMDCHSNETRWPWYAQIAPMSWLVAGDVEKARKVFNVSEWADHEGKRKGTAMGALMAACQGVKDKKMPRPQYQMMHPEARLSDADVQTFCTWSVAAIRELKSAPVRSAQLAR